MKTAGIIIIGNEILSGKVTDINSPYLCVELRILGVEVKQIITIPDTCKIIGKTVLDFSERFTWVFTSGELGQHTMISLLHQSPRVSVQSFLNLHKLSRPYTIITEKV